MLKVLIADDERIVRKTLRLIGNWDEYEMEIVGKAQNGMEALEMIDQRIAVLLRAHIDKIDDDDAADIAQTQLAGDFIRRFAI